MRRTVLLSPFLLSIGALLGIPLFSYAAGGDPVALPWWSAAPFVLMLLCIAVLPLIAGHFWHKNLNKFIISLVLGLPVVAYLLLMNEETQGGTGKALIHALVEYGAFIALLGSLYTISGGIMVSGDLKGRPMTNGTFLSIGAVLANFIGTTGASMLLIRPYLRMNLGRKRIAHLPIFFIFMVSNVGGLLTPLGDPPLFLGFLKKVDFFWTLRLWPEWLMVNGSVLLIFMIWDTIAYMREDASVREKKLESEEAISVQGFLNFLFLGGVIGAVLLKSYLPDHLRDAFISEGLMVLMAICSLVFSPKGLRERNQFSWGPILEVAVLFIGIFVTMAPALQLLKLYGPALGVDQPWQFFWMTGSLSAFLDNAPTYVTFGVLAGGTETDFSMLMAPDKAMILQGLSCGAVFMGALTYIGNGPNFMVKSITESMDVPMPSFFGYMAYSCLILIPIFIGVTFIFFSPFG